MDDRINAWLDGELPLEGLTPREQERARRVRAALDLAAGAEAGAAPPPRLADTVMATIGTAPAPRPSLLGRFRDGVLPALPLRPAAALAAACLAVGFGLGLWASSGGPGSAPGAGDGPAVAAGEAPTVFVRFDLRLDSARTVQLAGSFSGWQPAYELTPSGEGQWTVTVPLTPGVHDYVFVVDGERHVLDPAAPRIADGFGSYSNRIALLASST
jgi:Glycogen recognition site of AMP-activated protein kinase